MHTHRRAPLLKHAPRAACVAAVAFTSVAAAEAIMTFVVAAAATLSTRLAATSAATFSRAATRRRGVVVGRVPVVLRGERAELVVLVGEVLLADLC